MSFEDGILKESFIELLKTHGDTLVSQGRMRPSVIHDLADVIGPDLVMENGMVCDRKTGLTDAAKILEQRLGTRPHWAPSIAAPDAEAAAFGPGATLGARAALLKELGPTEFRERMTAWGCTMASLKPGTPPAGEGGKAAPKPPSASNPWANVSDNVDPKTGRYTANALGRQSRVVIAMGTEKAAGIAKAAGAFLGSSGPAARQLIPRG